MYCVQYSTSVKKSDTNAQMNGHYDVILWWDVLLKHGIVLDFEQQLVQWDDKVVKIAPTEFTQETSYVDNTPDIAAEIDRMLKILDAKYQPADLDKVAAKNENLTLERQKITWTAIKAWYLVWWHLMPMGGRPLQGGT